MSIQELLIRRKNRIELSDDELMGKLQQGDEQAFRTLYDRYKGSVFMYCLRIMNDRDAAKDVLQEVFIRLHLRNERYEPGTNFAGWIHTIARNLCLNARRAQRGHSSFEEGMAHAPSNQAAQGDVALRERLANEIENLPDLYREALVLREYNDHSYDEIAEILEVPMSTVKFRIFKAREILRDRLANSFGEYRGGNNKDTSE